MKKLKDPQEEWKVIGEKMITKQLQPNESMLISTVINLFDNEGNKNECVFFLTTKFVYNILDSKIIQKLPTNKISSVTVSKMENEFIIHLSDGCDCRYEHFEKEEIIENLIKLHRNIHSGLPIAIYFKDDVSLAKYMTKNLNYREKSLTLDGSSAESIDLDSPQIREKPISVHDFTLLKVLGRGTYGKVMLVKRKENGKLYALKAMKKVHIVEDERLEHTKVEKMILKDLQHPFLVNLEFCFQTTEKIFFVMQFMRGGDLFYHLKKEKIFDEWRVKFYVAQIALAIGHLHLYNIVYRDMKPENVLMGEDGYISLADFGMAKMLNPNTLANSFCGTPEYIAPEIIIGEGHGKEVDWWGLGILTYEMLAGIPPFYDTNRNIMFQSIQQSKVKFPPNLSISNEAKDFVLRCLEKNPKFRIGNLEDVQEIKAHPWFKDLNWSDLFDKKVPVPFKPTFESAFSTEYFDEQFTKEEPINSFTYNVDLDLIQQFDQEFPSVVYTDSI